MPSEYLINPLTNPIFLPVIARAAIVFAAGFLLILIRNRFSFAEFRRSTLGKIYLGWLILAPAYLVAIFTGRLLGLALLLTLAIIAIKEISRVAGLHRTYSWALYVLAALSLAVTSFTPAYTLSLPLAYFMVISFVAIRRNDGAAGFHHLALSMFTAIWVLFGLSHFVLLSNFNNSLDTTRSLLILMVFTVSLSDIGAYVFGKLFHAIGFLDRYKIANRISPHKTYIGILGHIIGAAGGVWLLYFAVRGYLPVGHWLAIAVLIGFFGMVGGMLNSQFKRTYGVKDSGSLIPGHGGILDRIDSSIRVVVIIYYYLLLVM